MVLYGAIAAFQEPLGQPDTVQCSREGRCCILFLEAVLCLPSRCPFPGLAREPGAHRVAVLASTPSKACIPPQPSSDTRLQSLLVAQPRTLELTPLGLPSRRTRQHVPGQLD